MKSPVDNRCEACINGVSELKFYTIKFQNLSQSYILFGLCYVLFSF